MSKPVMLAALFAATLLASPLAHAKGSACNPGCQINDPITVAPPPKPLHPIIQPTLSCGTPDHCIRPVIGPLPGNPPSPK